MITKEHVIPTYPYDYRFQTHDNKDRTVVIELENEWSVTSKTYPTWEYCLADACLKACAYADPLDIIFPVLRHEMVSKDAFLRALHELKA